MLLKNSSAERSRDNSISKKELYIPTIHGLKVSMCSETMSLAHTELAHPAHAKKKGESALYGTRETVERDYMYHAQVLGRKARDI